MKLGPRRPCKIVVYLPPAECSDAHAQTVREAAGRVAGDDDHAVSNQWEGHGVYRRFFGVITRAEFREAFEEMCGDIRYEGIRYIISDYLEAQPAPDIPERALRAQAKLERLRFYDSPSPNATPAAMMPHA